MRNKEQGNQKNGEKHLSESGNGSNFKTVLSAIFKIAAVLLFALIVALVCVDFFDTTKDYISYEIIVALCLVVIVVCLDSFDCFQLGNILRLEREKKIIEKDNKELKEQNNILMGIVSNIQNNIKIENSLHVIPTDGNQAKQEDNIKETDSYDINKESTAYKERAALLSYINDRIQKDLSAKTTIIWDPVLCSNVVQTYPDRSHFDLYVKQNGVEEFIEIKYLLPSPASFSLIDKQLFAIERYNYANHRNAQYVLIIYNQGVKDSKRLYEINNTNYKKLLFQYDDYIKSGLMKIIMR